MIAKFGDQTDDALGDEEDENDDDDDDEDDEALEFFAGAETWGVKQRETNKILALLDAPRLADKHCLEIQSTAAIEDVGSQGQLTQDSASSSNGGSMLSTGKETRPKPREVALQKYDYYIKYEVEHIHGLHQKNLVDDVAHDAMRCALKKWQDEDATRHDLERPSWTDW